MTDETTPTADDQLEAAQTRIAELEQELEDAKRVELISPEEQQRRWGQEILDQIAAS
ncbi:MAG TPA: hypothetical protein VFI18_08535 [Gaiellales bacterium]|nr:hypothetical protein [Gaiellales bacterium]